MANLSASAVRRKKRNSRHGRISRRRYQLLRDKYLRVRQERSGRLAASSAPSLEARARVLCECCFATIKINKPGETVGDETCKECHRLLCSNCCFASEKPPLWYCLTCIITRKLLRIWRPNTEGWCDRVLQERLREGVNILMRSINDLRRAEAQPAVDTTTTPVLHSLARIQEDDQCCTA